MPNPLTADKSNVSSLAEKDKNINEYKAATMPMKPVAPVMPVEKGPFKMDKVNPKGAPYGSRPGEKRIDLTLHKGTNYVPKDGKYNLQEGEAVVPKDKNPMNPYSKVTEGSAKEKMPKKSMKSMHVRKAHDGSYIAEHHHHHPMHKMEEHTAPDMKGMMAHMEEHMPNMEAEQPEEQTGAQAQGAALGMQPQA